MKKALLFILLNMFYLFSIGSANASIGSTSLNSIWVLSPEAWANTPDPLPDEYHDKYGEKSTGDINITQAQYDDDADDDLLLSKLVRVSAQKIVAIFDSRN